MKETVKTSRTAGYLEKIFRAINTDSFGGEIEEPIITLKNTSTAYGHVTVCKTWSKKDDRVHELNISTAYLKRPIEELVTTMIHEMVHLLNMQRGIQDCSRGGSYHNKKFKDEAEKHMIHIEHHEKYGWTITIPTDELLDYIIKKGWTEIQMGEESKLPDIFTKFGKSKSNSIKYQCPNCKNSVRATKVVNIKCAYCNQIMIEC